MKCLKICLTHINTAIVSLILVVIEEEHSIYLKETDSSKETILAIREREHLQ